jgi:RNA polymerase sigma-70 factor, ECF subfamily
MGEVSDDDLVERIRADDHNAFRTLFERYYDALCRCAEQHVEPIDAEEIVERLFVRLWARRAAWVIRRTVREYLFGAVRNEIRASRRQQRTHERLAPSGRAPSTPDEHLYASELETALWRAITALPPQRREAVTMRFRDARTYAEIAEAMDLSLKTVETHISRALKALRQVLRPYV